MFYRNHNWARGVARPRLAADDSHQVSIFEAWFCGAAYYCKRSEKRLGLFCFLPGVSRREAAACCCAYTADIEKARTMSEGE